MKRVVSLSLGVVLGTATLAGVAAVGGGIFRALQSVKVLVSIGLTGSRSQEDIQYSMQESRRAILQALNAGDVSRRLTYISNARGADIAIVRNYQALLSLDPPEATRTKLAAFVESWRAYLESRDVVFSLILRGQMSDADAVEEGSATRQFLRAESDLRAVRRTLDDFASEQADTVRTVFYQAFAEMAALGLATVLFVATLMWKGRQDREFFYMRQRNEELERADKLEKARVRVLEMAGRNESMEAVLDALALLVEEHLPGAAACIVVMGGSQPREIVGPRLPCQITGAYRLGLRPSTSGGGITEKPTEVSPDVPEGLWVGAFPQASALGLESCWSRSVVSSAGDEIGLVDLYFREPRQPGASDIPFLEGCAQLAAIVIQRRDLYERLAFQAHRDPLTELPNRRLFQDRLEQALHLAKRDNQQIAVLLIDLDRFKQVNDLLGHRVGDALLQEVARRVGGCIRQSDTLARIGGDEFTIILNRVASQEAAEITAQKVMHEICKPLTLLGHETHISASIGISLYPNHGDDPATLVRNADLAMYHAKGRGKNGWQTYVAELGAVLLHRMSIEKSLEGAIENDELEVFYQLQTNFDRQMVGIEALIRWRNPVLGSISPEAFIPVAEESGLIGPIGDWILDQACRQNAQWLQAGYPIVRVAVNISARQLGQIDFVERVKRTLESTGLPPQYLELELTETALIQNVNDCLDRVAALRSLGVAISIDDFGTGYSSLGYLQKLPVNSLKIDQSFISGIGGAQNTLPLIHAIVDLAHGLGLNVVAEGVETESQFEALRDAHCDVAQGYLIHKPHPAHDIEDRLRDSSLALVRLGEAVGAMPVEVPEEAKLSE